MVKFDVILFENSRESRNHIYDLRMIAEMLQEQGLRVAVLNVYGEYTNEFFSNIELIDLKLSHVCPKRQKPYAIHAIPFLIRQNVFYKELLGKIRNMADAFYFGSYNYYISTEILKFDKPFFLWGLRSFTFDVKLSKFFRNPLILQKLYFKHLMISNPCAMFFVSNNIIMNEFVNRGMPKEKMIIRDERTSDGTEIAHYEKLKKETTFLTIGWLREGKRVERTIEAFCSIEASDMSLYLVGMSTDEYEKLLKEKYDKSTRIKRVRHRLSDQEMEDYFYAADFVCFADYSNPKSTITNGTMMEALLHYRPIIAPNYNPFAYYIDKYGIGVSYDIDSKDSYVSALKKAKEIGCKGFYENISNFLVTINKKDSAIRLASDIKNIIITHSNGK